MDLSDLEYVGLKREFMRFSACFTPHFIYGKLDGLASLGLGKSNRAAGTAARAPSSCAKMNAGTWDGEMPAKVFESERAMVMAGLANEVDEVNQ